VDLSEPICLRVRKGLKPPQGILEEGERLGVGPAALRLLRRQDVVVHGFFVIATGAEMIGEKLHDFVDAPGIYFLESERGGRVVLAAAALEEAAVDDVLRQRVLEAVHKFRVGSGGEDEVQSV